MRVTGIARLDALPLIAILRGLVPDEAEAVGGVLIDSGWGALEVPLNSPQPFDSIARLARRFGAQALVGAGTVLSAGDAARVAEAGGRLLVTPHFDPAVVAAAKRHGLLTIPGVATPSEGFAALAAGADALKLFPAEAMPPPVVKAWRAVVPAGVRLMPVGGVTPESLAAYWQAGASGFGVGSALFMPGLGLDELRRRAERFVAAMRALLPA
ncbi:MAG: 2-dehydro-3-deoxy-6-phosphogalactonate aldolase [Rhodospirillaceae bacterium]|nr:2-dehydro-3-deoxy-6-phosphogalactonate aldolase [Rhodospirillaceae bacterium]